jgi:hypothetical protein
MSNTVAGKLKIFREKMSSRHMTRRPVSFLISRAVDASEAIQFQRATSEEANVET